MSDNPSPADIEQWLTEQKHPTTWATFLVGLPWEIIRPTCQIAKASKAHPALALGLAAAYTADPEVKRVAREHLARHDPTTPTPDAAAPTSPNRAARRTAARSQRRAR